jgi:cytosine/adenosine deaminase-related metal-dependent hydrolase
MCDEGKPQSHGRSTQDPQPDSSRRHFLKTSSAAALGAGVGLNFFAARPARADDDDDGPEHSGRMGRRYIIRGGHVMSMDPKLGNFAQADVLVEGKKILAVGPNLRAADAGVIDARGRIVMPGFVDTHHHLFETALRGFLANGVLIADGTAPTAINYFQHILQTFAPVYRPEDVYISELFGSLSQLDAGVTTVHDISQIHHSPAHSDAAIQALLDSRRRAAFGYFESAGGVAGNQYPDDARRIRKQWFSSDDQLVTMVMGGEIYLPGFERAWAIGRELNLQVAAHILSPFGMRPTFDHLARTNQFGPDNLFIHVTGMSDLAWQAIKDAGARVSLAVPIEMNMRHGMPPILKTISLGIQPSLSTDVEVTLNADMFYQMRSTMNLQRALVNQTILDSGFAQDPPNFWPAPPAGTPALLQTQDVLRFATINGAKDLRLDQKIGSLTPGKEADILLLNAEALNVAPLNNVPGAVVALMDRSNVETVIVAGAVRKWKGKLRGVDMNRLRTEVEASRDRVFAAAGIPQDLFRAD